MKPRKQKNGYLCINLYKDGKQKTYRIHRLVATAFLSNQENLLEIDHINKIKEDNRIENLRWCSKGNNLRNKKKKEGTTSQFQGVSWFNLTNKWRARISLNRKKITIGYFDTEQEAYSRWCEVVRENNLQEFYGI